MTEQTQFQTDLDQPIQFNGKVISRGMYNLLVSIRDVKLYSKGLKPHRGWQIGDVKRYFGIKGNVLKIIEQLEDFKKQRLSI